MKNARVCALRKAPPCARFFIEASAATAAFPLRRRERARQPARRAGRTPPKIRTETPLHANAVARAYATEIRTETPLHAKRGRPCVRHPKSAQKHRCMQNAVARAYATRNPHRNTAACKNSVARAGDRAAAESAETPANRNARASPEPPAGFCLRRLEKRRAFARAFRCADKSAPGMPRPCSPLRRFRLRVHCRT